jgi:hypothetical protein
MKAINLFYTPQSMEEMQDIISDLPKGDQALVYPYVMMMYNLTLKLAAEKCAAIADEADVYQTYNVAGEIKEAFGLKEETV